MLVSFSFFMIYAAESCGHTGYPQGATWCVVLNVQVALRVEVQKFIKLFLVVLPEASVPQNRPRFSDCISNLSLGLIASRLTFQHYHRSTALYTLRVMWILPLVGYFGVVVGFAFLTLAIGMAHGVLT